MLRHVVKGDEITLFSTASRCLELLIEKHGTTLSQKELMDAAWLGQGHSVTPNTFYQNISNVRKAFSALLPERQIIVTIKRVGLLIPDEITVTPVNPEVTDNSPTLVISDVDSIMTKEVVSPTRAVEVVSMPSTSILSNSIPPTSPKAINTSYSLLSRVSIGLFLLSLIVLAGSIYFHYKEAQEVPVFPFRNYVIYKKFNNGCTILINPDAGRIDPMNRYLNSSSDCKGYKEMYVTLWEQRMTTSAMYCSPADDGIGYSCVSEYFARSPK